MTVPQWCVFNGLTLYLSGVLGNILVGEAHNDLAHITSHSARHCSSLDHSRGRKGEYNSSSHTLPHPSLLLPPLISSLHPPPPPPPFRPPQTEGGLSEYQDVLTCLRDELHSLSASQMTSGDCDARVCVERRGQHDSMTPERKSVVLTDTAMTKREPSVGLHASLNVGVSCPNGTGRQNLLLAHVDTLKNLGVVFSRHG